MLVLFVFGPPVEHRIGGRAFILYYLYCGIGAAVLSLVLSGIMSSAATPVVGASGAVLGVAVAFALLWPDAELLVFPLPMPVKARTLILVLVGLDIVLSQVTPRDGVAHLAHVGGAGFGYLFFRLQALSRRSPRQPPRAVERVVMVQSGAAEPERRTPPAPLRPRRRAETDPVAAEVDRVLDKISEQGMNSLTPAERRFLDEVARKKKQEH
jgi:Rhomboid family